jgi:hypothetical protein
MPASGQLRFCLKALGEKVESGFPLAPGGKQEIKS